MFLLWQYYVPCHMQDKKESQDIVYYSTYYYALIEIFYFRFLHKVRLSIFLQIMIMVLYT